MTRQRGFAVGGALALRLAPQFGVFAAAADACEPSLQALAALVPADGVIIVKEDADFPAPDGCAVVAEALCDQMVLRPDLVMRAKPGIESLNESDAAEMLALAQLTVPGPFFSQTHRLGRFVGVRREGRLVAMAGERLQPHGYTEVSGVCTHPDYRGQGYARQLMQAVMAGILQRGETPILHVYSANTGAIALYRAIGFAKRRQFMMTTLRHA
jgi:predicted GNAT family acetyltransferase